MVLLIIYLVLNML